MKDDALPSPVQSPLLATQAGNTVRHGFFTRSGGVSKGLYRGLNVGLGSSDIREDVLENRTRVARWFGLGSERLATVHQVHSPTAIVVTEDTVAERPHADAMVTATPGIVIGVLSADCGPILFADPVARVIGAAHAGWKGALDGVLESTIEAMLTLGADRNRIRAALGPSISQAAYEVGPEFVERFTNRDPDYGAFFKPSAREDHAMFDLPGLTISRLTAAGVMAENLDICTYPNEEQYFSYRRTTHRHEPDYGRQISAIALLET